MLGCGRGFGAGFAVLGLLIVAGCSDRTESVDAEAVTKELSAIGDPGIDRSPFAVGWGEGTAAGSDLVVIGHEYDPTPVDLVALRRPDGTWWELPSLPFSGFIELATAGDRAVAGGIVCADEECSSGRQLGFAMLNDAHTDWVLLDAPTASGLLTEDTEMTTNPGPSDFAEFAIGGSLYSVSSDGEIVDWAAQPAPDAAPGSRPFGCTFDGDYFSMQMTVSQVVELGGGVWVQPFGASETPMPAGTAPPGDGPWRPLFCAGGVLSVANDESEANFDLETRTWAVGPSNRAEMPDRGWISPISGRLAVSPDRTAIFTGDGPVTRQLTVGSWEATGQSGHVFATDTEVLLIDDDQNVHRLWPA